MSEINPLDYVSEKSFQEQVIQFLHLKGYLVFHVFEQAHYARRVGHGYPDITATNGKVILFLELKSGLGTCTDAQKEWIDKLTKVKSKKVIVRVLRPQDWNELEEMVK